MACIAREYDFVAGAIEVAEGLEKQQLAFVDKGTISWGF
jgi:hypothetical protein